MHKTMLLYIRNNQDCFLFHMDTIRIIFWEIRIVFPIFLCVYLFSSWLISRWELAKISFCYLVVSDFFRYFRENNFPS